MRLFPVPTSDSFAVISIATFLIVSFSSETSAKRGCTAFGHSCFGGHGKRSELTQHGIVTKERNGINQEVPEYVHTNDGTFAMEPSQKIQERPERRIPKIDRIQMGDDPLSIIIRQWMIARHRPFAGARAAYK